MDVKLIQVPDMREISADLAQRIRSAFVSMTKRDVGGLIEEDLMDCHTVELARKIAARPIVLSHELAQADRRALDDAVLEMIGVKNQRQRTRLLDELYAATAQHFRQVRVMEIQKQVQRAGGAQRRLTLEDLAASVWDSLDAAERGPKLMTWLAERGATTAPVNIPDGTPRANGNGHMFAPGDVDFAQGDSVQHETYLGPEQANLVKALAELDIRGSVELPNTEPACREWRKAISERLDAARKRFDDLAAQRTGDSSTRENIVMLLESWYVHGRGASGSNAAESREPA